MIIVWSNTDGSTTISQREASGYSMPVGKSVHLDGDLGLLDAHSAQ